MSAPKSKRSSPSPYKEESSKVTQHAIGARAPWIMVIGTGELKFAEELEPLARDFGEALAKNGFNLATFGWEGVEEVVAYSFAKATGLSKSELENRLVHFVDGQRQPRYRGGWSSRLSTEADAVSMALTYIDGLVIIGGASWSFRFAKNAEDAGIPIVPLVGNVKGSYAANHFYNEMVGLAPSRVRWDAKDLLLLAQGRTNAIYAAINMLLQMAVSGDKANPPTNEPTISFERRERLLELLADKQRLSRMIAGGALLERSFIRWVQSPLPNQFFEAIRVFGIKSVEELVDFEQRLNKQFADFRPNPLWKAWFLEHHAAALVDVLKAAVPKSGPEPIRAEQRRSRPSEGPSSEPPESPLHREPPRRFRKVDWKEI